MTYSEDQLEAFVTAYLETLLWCTSNEEGRMLDDDYGIEDIDATSMHRIKADCQGFLELCYTDQGYVFDHMQGEFRGSSDITWSRLEQAAHDYALTRNGHGAGFWDRSEDTYPEMCLWRLTELSKSMGSMDLYVGDDNLIYFC